MSPPGMFSRPDGTNIAEIRAMQFTHWVTVDFTKFGGRTKPTSGDRMMSLMAEQCRSGVATVTTMPLHHTQPCCLSLPVVGDAALVRVHILWRAAEIADSHREDIMAGKLMIDTKRILGGGPGGPSNTVNGA
ncbi:hypothetical protein N7516_011150 [Penicillium verrucosum]|uniref:uncharacterized protein n=1 Tax=Penicillium verrucosum TaxID=60171 RepID=UPI0025459637|nr:uncharacterized protein N7516_011150 [Penicillium verrucosum]KAJ5920292.1 hypothetical protein N7516_011150 [Penicillium verrucosum]